MKLEKGITGFWKEGKDRFPTQIDEKKMKECAYRCDRSTNFKLKKILNPDSTSNYYKLLFINKTTLQELNVIINSSNPFYAGLISDSKWMNLKFIDLPSEIKACFDQHFTYLDPISLAEKLTTEDLSSLSQSEANQIRYWDSKTYGEVIFNGYD